MEETEVIANKKTFRNYMLMWSGQLFSLMGSLIVQFVITWWVTEVTGSAVYLSIGMFLYFLPMVFVTPFAGVLTDRFNRKTIITVADSLQALVTLWIIVMFYMNYADPFIVILINSLRGLCQAFHQPVIAAIIPSMVPKERLSRINGINFLFTSLIQLIGPVIGATLLAFFPINLILWMDIITFGIAITPLLLVTIPFVGNLPDIRMEEKISFRKEFKEGMLTIKLIPGLLIILLLSMVLNFLITPLNVLMPYFVYAVHLGSAIDLATIMMGFNLGMICGALITALKKNWKHKVIVYFSGLIIVMGTLSTLGFAPRGSFLLMAGVAIITGIALPIVNTIYMTIVQTVVPANKMGRVSSVDQSLSMAIYPIGTLISGPLAEILGVQNLFIYSAFIGVLITFLTWRFTKVRRINYDDHLTLATITEKINNINVS